MKRRLNPLAALILAAAATATAYAAPTRKLAPGAKITIDGQSSVRAFTCKARTVAAQIAGDADAALSLGEQLKTLITDAQLEIPAKGLDCGDATMNQHMYDALKAEEHKQIRFRITGLELGAAGPDSVPVKLKGELTLSGRTLPLSVSATATATATGGVRLHGAHLLRMTDWGVNPPSLFFGTMKVRDSVVIRFDIAAEAPAAQPLAGT
jgi:polyisoprenoid-binding protein YceI